MNVEYETDLLWQAIHRLDREVQELRTRNQELENKLRTTEELQLWQWDEWTKGTHNVD